jgi:hypothetical protein
VPIFGPTRESVGEIIKHETLDVANEDLNHARLASDPDRCASILSDLFKELS